MRYALKVYLPYGSTLENLVVKKISNFAQLFLLIEQNLKFCFEMGCASAISQA
tara:strand:- start:640 stop:798 length:159 start_codon:yes stop_codon:yes gene_type:complete